jgi:hypothetical protein
MNIQIENTTWQNRLLLQQLLVVAARAGNAHDITALLARGATDDGSALHAACAVGSIACVRCLCARINYAPMVNDYDSYMDCPYHAAVKLAIRIGDLEFLHWIVDDIIIPLWEPAYGAMCEVSLYISADQYRVAEFFLQHGSCENGRVVPGNCGKRVKEDDISHLKVSVFDDHLPQTERDSALRCLALLSAGGQEFPVSKHMLVALAELKQRQNARIVIQGPKTVDGASRQNWLTRLASWVL